MIRFFKRLMSYSVYRKTLFAYAVSVVVITVAILLSTFGVLSYYIRESSTQNSELMLDQLLQNSDNMKSDVDLIFSLVYSDPDTLTFMANEEENKVHNYYLYQTLSDIKAAYTYVVDISVINFKNGTCIQSYGTNVGGTTNMDFARSVADENRAVPRKVSFYQPRQEYDVVSFCKFMPYSDSAIIVDVNAERFNYIINSLDSARSVYIVDSDGNGISANTSELIGGEPYSRYFTKVIRENKKNQFVYNDEKNQMILFFSKSSGLDWWYIDAQSYSSFYQAYQKVSATYITISVSFLVLCIIISILFGRKIRAPLIALVNKYRSPADAGQYHGPDELRYIDDAMKRIEHERYLGNKYVVSQYLKNTVLGEEMPFFVSREKLRELSASFQSAFYTVLLIRIDTLDDIAEAKLQEEYGILRFTVCNLADEIFGEYYQCKAVDMGGQDVAVLLMTNKKELGEKYYICYSRLQEFARTNVNVEVRGSVGNTVSTQREIYISYKNALQYMQMGSLVGRDELIDSSSALNVNYKEKNEKLVASIEEYTSLNYANPGLSLKGIAQTFELSSSYLGKIFKSVRGCSYSAYLTGYRLERSKILMLETSQTINEIALEVGFANSTYYATVFKSAYGMTPSVYRSNLK